MHLLMRVCRDVTLRCQMNDEVSAGMCLLDFVVVLVVVLCFGVQIERLTVENSPASVQETLAAVRHGVDGQALTGIGSIHVVDAPHPFHFDNPPDARLATEASTEVSDTVPVFRLVCFAIRCRKFLP